MIGRLNHVAIAVPDLAGRSRSTATRWAPQVSDPGRSPTTA